MKNKNIAKFLTDEYNQNYCRKLKFLESYLTGIETFVLKAADVDHKWWQVPGCE